MIALNDVSSAVIFARDPTHNGISTEGAFHKIPINVLILITFP